LSSFGEKLKLEREKRKITLEQISSSTKIGTRMLQALEEDKFNQLPGGIFNKGFVRAYSRCVGLDEDQTVAEYLQASGDAPPVRAEPSGYENAGREAVSQEDRARESQQNVRRLENISDTPPRSLPWGLFAAILLVVALVLSFWSHRQRERARLSALQTPAAAVAPMPNAASQETGSASPTSTLAANDAPTAGSPASGSPTGEVASAASKTTTDLPAALPGEFTVVIQAREESWISINVDGKATPSELMAAGSERTIRGRKEITVKAGNSGGVDFRFNGKKLETGGEYGEVKTVTFGPGGMSPTAAATPSTP
jgi:cytoskeletal protein RodZ